VILVAVAAYLLADPSIKGMGFLFFVMPTGVALVGVALVGFGRALPALRIGAAILAAAIGFMGWDLLRNDGIWGDFRTSLHWRWEPTAEETFLASIQQQPAPAPAAGQASAADETPETIEWSDFRGPRRDGAVPGVVLDTDWQAHPPRNSGAARWAPAGHRSSLPGTPSTPRNSAAIRKSSPATTPTPAPSNGFTSRRPASGSRSPDPVLGPRPRSAVAGCMPWAPPAWCTA
jgi:hypothetical protein